MKIDLTKSTEQILEEWSSEILKQSPELTKEQTFELAEKTMPFLKCKANDGKRVIPSTCMFCPYGHMTDCHFPDTCNEANCSHYRYNYR